MGLSEQVDTLFFGNLKADVPSNSIYQHKTNINNWAGLQWDIDAHVGT